MSRGDTAVETAADKLETLVQEGRASGGVKAKLAEQFSGDPEFLRKLKPTLIKARAKGEAPPPRPSPEPPRPKPKRPGGGPSPWLVVGVALVTIRKGAPPVPEQAIHEAKLTSEAIRS